MIQAIRICQALLLLLLAENPISEPELEDGETREETLSEEDARQNGC